MLNVKYIKKTNQIKFHHTVLMFILVLVWFLIYLFSVTRDPLPVYIFWASVISLSFLIVWQIDKVENRLREIVILSEIVMLNFVFHLIFVITVPYGLFGRDVHSEYYVMKTIEEYGWPIPDGIGLLETTKIYSKWPMIHIIGLISSQILNVKLFSVKDELTIMKIFPPIITSIIVPMTLYVLVKRIYNTQYNKVGLIVAFSGSSLFYNLMFHTWFVRETLGYILFFQVIYFLISNNKYKRIAYLMLMIIYTVTLLLSHHLTYFLFIILVCVMMISSFVTQYTKERLGLTKDKDTKVNAYLDWKTLVLFVIILFVSFISYLMYIGIPIFYGIVLSINALFSSSKYFIIVETQEDILRHYMILISRIFFATLFGSLMILELFKKSRNILWNLIGVLWSTFNAFLVVISAILKKVLLVPVPRLEAFTYPIILIPVTYTLYYNLKSKKFIYILSVFIIFNLFLIPPYIYNPSTSSYESGEASMRYNLTDYMVIKLFKGNEKVLGDCTVGEILGGLKQVEVNVDPYTTIDIWRGNLNGIHHYDLMVIRSEDFKVLYLKGGSKYKLSEEVFKKYETSWILSKIYNNGNVVVYKVLSSH